MKNNDVLFVTRTRIIQKLILFPFEIFRFSVTIRTRYLFSVCSSGFDPTKI